MPETKHFKSEDFMTIVFRVRVITNIKKKHFVPKVLNISPAFILQG